MIKLKAWFGILTLALGLALVLPPEQASAVATLVNTANTTSNNGSVQTASFPTAAVAGNLLIAVCAANAAVTVNTPTDFSVAISQSGTPTQAIFYKIAVGGETGVTCTFSASGFVSLHIYQYSGVSASSTLLATGSDSGTGTAVGSGSLTTTSNDALLFAGVAVSANTTYSAWSNTFTERADYASSGGNPGQRKTYGSADRNVSVAGTYSTTATAGVSGEWRGQIVAFRLAAPVLGVDIVDASGIPVVSPTASLTAATASFNCQTVTGTLGVSTQRIRVINATASAAWTVAVAATGGATAVWNSGTNTYDFNDASGAPAGCSDGGDADSLAGRLTLNPTVGTITPQAGCANTGISSGASNSFTQGSVDSITLLSAAGTAGTNCYWDFTGVGLSQTIPSRQPAGSYTLGLTLTITAN